MAAESLLGAMLIVGVFVFFGGCLAWADWSSRLPPKARK
jgi:hypothetical protein